jgi:serine/threonine protein kinase
MSRLADRQRAKRRKGEKAKRRKGEKADMAADANRQTNLFGRLALARRLITEEQLKECLDLQAAGSTKRLGEILVNKGYLTQEEVFEIIQMQQRRAPTRGPGAPTLAYGLKLNDLVGGFYVKREIAQKRLGATLEVIEDRKSGALKIMSKDQSVMQGARFREAARGLKELTGLSPCLPFTHREGLFSGNDFVISEWFKLGDIRDKLGIPMPLDQALRLMQAICSGVALAHSKKIIHGDIRPRKIMRRADGTLALRDFAYSPMTVPDPAKIHRSECRYLAPEQLVPAGKCTTESDVYALCGIFYELLTGQSAFSEKDDRIIEHIRRGRFDRIGKLRTDLPRDVEAVISQGMATLHEERYESAESLLEDIECLMTGQAVRAERMRSTRRVVGWLRKWFKKDK